MAEFDAIIQSALRGDPRLRPSAEDIFGNVALDLDNVISIEQGRTADPFDVPPEEVFGSFEVTDWNSDDENYFDANLAKFMDRRDLDRLAEDVIEWVRRDRVSRGPWEAREARGIEQLGVLDTELEKWKKADPEELWMSNAVHPGLQKACIQFWARAMTQLWPAGGPSKTIVLGASDRERQQQAKRVADFMNYLYTQEMAGAHKEMSQLLYRLPLSGSVFKKQFYDTTLGTLATEFIEPTDLIKPYSASELKNATRYTHMIRITRSKLLKMIAAGVYLNVMHRRFSEEERIEHSLVDFQIDRAHGHRPMTDSNIKEQEFDNRDILFESSAFLDLSERGYDDPYAEEVWTDRETGAIVDSEKADESKHERVGLGVPYLITVHKFERRVMSIRRHWRKDDERKRRRPDVVEYQFLPGLGGYGFGLLHIAGGLNDTQTRFMRYLADGAELKTKGTVSGYVAQNAVGITGLPGLRMGRFQRAPGNIEDFSKAIWTPDFKWDAADPVAVLQYFDGLLEFLVASTESMIGDATKNMPVGTVVARMKEISRPFAAIFSMLHTSFAEEMKSLAQLSSDHLPQYYPYAVEGADQFVMSSDFDRRIDVVPVSDPNYTSGTERILTAEALLKGARENIDVLGPEPLIAAWRQYVEILRVSEVEQFMPRPAPPMVEQEPPPDPVVADIARKDAESAANIRRKDAESGAEMRRKALEQRMAVSPGAREEGDEAIVQQELMNEAERTRNRIIETAMARRAQMPAEAGLPT